MPNASPEESIFIAALEFRDDAARAHYLANACGADQPLRQRVEHLLAAYPVGEFLEAPAADLAATALLPALGEQPGDTIGNYKLLEQIGEGGMGLVFMAEQSQPLRRRVALKIIKPGLDTRAVIARFEAERQALALMDHPNIARVFDAGATDSGRPYFVMELVRGAPITEYCREQQLPLRERLELFIEVCHAVQHAHQKGVIHRDLKPANILVAQSDTAPIPKVIDFGVAKAIAQPLTERTLFTGFAQIIGTPLYMSPEQADWGNQDIDTRSDVYSLGVILYELLTGATPFDGDRLRSVSHDEMRRIIREEEPPRPSTRATTAAVALSTLAAKPRAIRPPDLAALKGELDWIVMKALDKDRRRRYESPNALARDIERHMADEPVEACRPTFRYKVRKFAVRYKSALAAGIAAFLLSLVGVGVGADHFRQIRESSRYVQDSLAVAREALAENDVNQALQRVAEAETRINAVNLKNQQLLVEASALRTEASRYATFLGLLEEARMYRSRDDKSIAPADEALRSYQVLDSPDWLAPLIEQDLPQAYIDRVQDAVYELLLLKADHLTRWQETRSPANTRLALRCLEKAVTFHAPSRGYYWLKANCAKLSEDPDGEKLLRAQAMETAPSHAAELFYIIRDREWGLASVHQGHPKYSLDESLKDYREMLRYDPTYYNGVFFMALRLAEAGHEAEALALWYGCAAANPRDTIVLVNRGVTLVKLGQYEEAVTDLLAAIKRMPNYAMSYFNLGECYYKSNRFKEAIASYTEAIRLDPSLLNALQSRGSVYLELEQYDAALADYQEAIRLSPNNSNNHGGSAAALAGLRRFHEAQRSFEEALRLDPRKADAANDLAWLLATCPEESLRNPKKALELAEKAVHLAPDEVDFQGTLGAACYRNGDFAAAAEALRKSAADIRVTEDSFFLAMAEWKLGNHDTAREVLSKAVKWVASQKSNLEERGRLRAEAEQVLGNTSSD